MKRAPRHLRWTLALLAWLAQLCLPVAHAAMMAAPSPGMADICGDSSRVAARLLTLAMMQSSVDVAGFADPLGPDDLTKASPHHLDHCAKLCATAAAPAPLPPLAPTVALRAAGLEVIPAIPAPPVTRGQSPPPPAQGPPARV